MNHPLISQIIDEQDEKILDHLKALDVTFTDDVGSFKVHLVSRLCSFPLAYGSIDINQLADAWL